MPPEPLSMLHFRPMEIESVELESLAVHELVHAASVSIMGRDSNEIHSLLISLVRLSCECHLQRHSLCMSTTCTCFLHANLGYLVVSKRYWPMMDRRMGSVL